MCVCVSVCQCVGVSVGKLDKLTSIHAVFDVASVVVAVVVAVVVDDPEAGSVAEMTGGLPASGIAGIFFF